MRRIAFGIMLVAIMMVLLSVLPALAQEPAPPVISGETVDAFEVDDTPGQATVVNEDIVKQIHNFGVQGDQDWIRFEACAGVRYTFKARPYLPGMDMSVSLELFQQEGTGYRMIAKGEQMPGETVLTFVPAVNSVFFLRMTESDGKSGPDYAYTISSSHTDCRRLEHMIPLPEF